MTHHVALLMSAVALLMCSLVAKAEARKQKKEPQILMRVAVLEIAQPGKDFQGLKRWRELSAARGYCEQNGLQMWWGCRAPRIAQTVKLLRGAGVARPIAMPNLIALDRNTASFQAGGRFPFSISRAAKPGSKQRKVCYRPYGAQLQLTPSVLKGDRLRLEMEVELAFRDEGIPEEGSVCVSSLSTRPCELRTDLGAKEAIILVLLMPPGDSKTAGSLMIIVEPEVQTDRMEDESNPFVP